MSFAPRPVRKAVILAAGTGDRFHRPAHDPTEASWWSPIIWRVSFVATRSAMPYGLFAFSIAGLLSAIVVLAAIGANIYWISLVVKLRHLQGEADTEAFAA